MLKLFTFYYENLQLYLHLNNTSPNHAQDMQIEVM